MEGLGEAFPLSKLHERSSYIDRVAGQVTLAPRNDPAAVITLLVWENYVSKASRIVVMADFGY